MKRRVIIVHGWEGSPTSDWIGWATHALTEKGYEAIAPTMPNASHPVLEKWVEHLRSAAGAVDESTYFIGHSVACLAILHFVQTIDTKAGGALFVAGWFDLDQWFASQNREDPEIIEEEEIAKPWIQAPLDFEKVRANLPKTVVALGGDDPVVDYKKMKEMFETKLGSEVVPIHGAGHMDAEDGFSTFPQLIEIFESRFDT